MNIEKLQSQAIRIQVCKMNSITMSETNRVKQFAIVIQGCRSPNNLILTITIYISYRQVVITISKHSITSPTRC